MNSYKGITFAKDYNRSFADFKEEFGSTHVFNNIHPKFREVELEKAFQIAISQSVKKIEVNEVEILKSDGHTSRAIDKSKKLTAK